MSNATIGRSPGLLRPRKGRPRGEWIAGALLVGVAAAWGSSFLAAKDLAADVGVLPALSLRFVFAAVAAGALVLLRRERMPRGRGLLIAIVLGVFQATIIGLETWGVHLTSATNAGLISSLALIGTPLLESIASRRWLPPAFFVAAVVAVVGVALLLSGDGFHTPTIGDVALLTAAAVRSLRVVTGGHLLRARTESSLSVVFIQVCVGAVVFTIAAAPVLGGALGRLDAHGWFDILYLGSVCSVLAFAIELWATRRTSAARASILLATEPLWAVTAGWMLGGEILGPVGWLGGALIVAASCAGSVIERRHREEGGGVDTRARRQDRPPGGAGAAPPGPGLSGHRHA
jgi:drug/metabolite transporter (DMT)-like permease